MFLCMLEKKKAPMYAPYVMKLIIAAETSSPLVKTQLILHKSIQPKRREFTLVMRMKKLLVPLLRVMKKFLLLVLALALASSMLAMHLLVPLGILNRTMSRRPLEKT